MRIEELLQTNLSFEEYKGELRAMDYIYLYK